jgi:predicted phage terminase large subunit-like protein
MLDSLHTVDRLEKRLARYLPPAPTGSTQPTDAQPFAEYLEAQGLDTPPHIQRIGELITRVDAGETIRAIIAMPPRHGKTETVLRGLSWLLQRDPARVHAFTTYAAELSWSKSRHIRRYAIDAGLSLDRATASVSEWRTTQGGGVLATGVGGPLTGQGVTGLAVVDDPVKNRSDAESPTMRERVWGWFTDVFYTRLEPGSSAIVIATRWHLDDLVGRLLEADEPWELLQLPALAEHDDPLGREPGEALWPARYPAGELEKIKTQIGEFSWASLYQQHPRARGTTVFRDVHYYDALPSGGYREAVGVDFAYTAKTHADYSVGVRGRTYDGDTIYVTHYYRDQVEMPSFAAILKAWNAPVMARIGGTEKSVIQFLMREHGLSVTTTWATTDKFTFAQPTAADWNAGKILLPRDAPWVPEFLSEVLSFTGVADAHDDIVDALGALQKALTSRPQIFV